MESSRVVIDTDILIDLLKDREQARTLLRNLEKKNHVFCTTVINVYELYYGLHKIRQWEKRLQSTEKLLGSLPILPLTPRSAQKAGHVFAALEAKGQSIGLGDVFIAAITLTKGYGLVTRNVDHFRKIEGLSIISP
jgi:predicted nucleic acid-binding protein